MREIGSVGNSADGQRLADYLRTLGIRSRVDPRDDGATIWVYDEDQRERAAGELAQFLANPADPRYDQAAQEARRLEREAESAEQRYRRNMVDVRGRWTSGTPRRGPVTLALLAISVAVAVASSFGEEKTADSWIADLFIVPIKVIDDGRLASPGLRVTLTQQPWRLVTPIFIHFGILHLLFNMFMVSDLGNQIESRRGSWRMLALVLAIAIPSNVAQYLYTNPLFGGLSGVAYGLFGYIWMKSRFDPGAGFYLHQRDVTIMLLWFVLCLAGIIPHVANVVHGVGLAVGMVIGIAPTVWREWRG